MSGEFVLTIAKGGDPDEVWNVPVALKVWSQGVRVS